MATIREIIDWFEVRGNRILPHRVDMNLPIVAPKAIQEAEEVHLSFVTKKFADQALRLIHETACRLILVEAALLEHWGEVQLPQDKVLVVSDQPKGAVIDFCKAFLGFQAQRNESKIHPTAVIAEGVTLGKCIEIGPYVVIEAKCVVGDYSSIGAHTVLKENTVVGREVEIGACNVIGGTGFGYSKLPMSEEYTQFPHYGSVVIQDSVHIGNNTCIDRGSLSDTVIGEGVKIDNLVHIAHNVKVGKNALVIACSMIAGSVEIGENCWVAPSTAIRNGLKIGANTTVGLGSTVTKSITSNATVTGSPAIPLEEFLALRAQQKGMIQAWLESQKKS